MPSVPELQSEAQKWQRRISMVGSAGLNTGPITELARTDLTRVMQGGTPYAEDQITAMVYGAYTGRAQLSQGTDQQKADSNPFHWIGNAIKDIGADVRDWPVGVVHTGADILNPHKWAEIPGGLSKAASDLPNIVQAMKDFNQTPILGPITPLLIGAIPGGEPVAAGMLALTAAGQGWTGFTQHPLNFALNVLPLVDVGTKFAAAGATVDEMAHTATQAMKEGKPFAALARAQILPPTVAGGNKTSLEQRFVDMAKNGSGGPLAQYVWAPVWREYDRLKRVVGKAFATGVLDQMVKDGIVGPDMSLEMRQQLYMKAVLYQPRYESE